MLEEPPAAAGAAAAYVASPAPEQSGASGDGCTMRVLVQKTFIEVVAEDQSCASVRRVRSAPAAPTPTASEHEQASGVDAALGLPGLAAGLVGTLSSSAEGPDGQEHDGDRTTVVVRNLPPSYTRDLLLELLDAHGFSGLYDFVYVPYEFGSSTSFGFGFVNLTGPEHAARFKAEFEGFSSWQAHCQREAAVGWSFTQGYEAHVDRFRNSPVMDEAMPDCCKPAVFEGGARVDFPSPTKRLPPLRRQRRRPKPGEQGGAPAPAASAGEDELAPPAGGLAQGSLLAAGLYPGAGEAAPSWADLSESTSWADLSEGPSLGLGPGLGLESLLGPALCPGRELRARSPPSGRLAPAAAAREDQHSGSSTDVPGSRAPSKALPQEPSSSQLSSASGSERADTARRCPRRGKRAGKRTAKSSASAAPWSAGSILLPGLVAFEPLDDGPLGSIVDEHEPP